MTTFFRQIVLTWIYLLMRVSKHHRIESGRVSFKALSGVGIACGKGTSVDGSSSIGSYTYVGEHSYITKSAIGRYVSIGNHVVIGPGEHDLTRVSTSALFYDDPYNQLTEPECVIGNDVWIGTHAVVLRGVRVGHGAVIAANAVVTRDIPNFAVAAGVPARIIKYRFDEAVARRILESRWWEYDKKKASDILKDLEDE